MPAKDNSAGTDHIETFWEKAAKTEMGKYLTSIESKFLLKAIDFSKCRLVIDLGAGAGKFSLLASQNNAEVVALDISLKGLKRIKSKNDLIDVILADARHLPIKENAFDAAFMMEVLDYIPESEAVFNDTSRILKNGGSLVFSFGNRSSFKSIIRRILGREYIHSYHNVIKVLHRTGFKIVDKEGYNWLPFGRTSENPLVPLFAEIERILGLRKLSCSPWILIHSIKTG